MIDFGTYIAGRTITDDLEGVVTEIFNGAKSVANDAPNNFPDFATVERFLRSVHVPSAVEVARLKNGCAPSSATFSGRETSNVTVH